MNDATGLDATLDAFLADGVEEINDRVIDAALAEIDETPQRRARRARRFPSMAIPSRVAVAAVAVVAVATTLVVLRPDRPSISAPATTPSAVASSRASASAAASLAPTSAGPSSWSTAGVMSVPRYLATATQLTSGLVLIAGGDGARSGRVAPALASAELYDPATGVSTPTGSMSVARAAHTATLLADGRVLVAGGYDEFAALDSAELYDPTTGTWTATGSMAEGHGYHAATLLPDGRTLVVGGRSNDSSTGQALSTAELFDPASQRWARTADLVRARAFPTATILSDGGVLVTGASYNGYAVIPRAPAERYDPGTGTWTETSGALDAVAYETATRLSDGRVVVAGGDQVVMDGHAITRSGDVVATVSIYDPAQRAWSTSAPMTVARAFHSAVVLPDGKLLVLGGEVDPQMYEGTSTYSTGAGLPSTEILDPVNGSWTAGAPMATGRAEQSTVLLPDGRVLVFGGLSSSKALASIESYGPATGG